MHSNLTIGKRPFEDDEIESPGTERKRSRPSYDSAQVGLLELLDLSGLANVSDIQARFSLIARRLLSDYHMCLERNGENHFYELLEIEFYWNNHSWHPDPFCHPGPRNICEWHFHKAPRRSPTLISTQSKQTHAGGFRGGTRKGLDLTFGLKDGSLWTGDVASQPSGGILLRSMLRVEDKVVISGPSLLVDEILRVFDAPNLKTLVSTTWGDSLFALRRPDHKESTVICMHLVKKESVGTCPIIHTSPRVGLDLSHPSTKPEPSDNRVAFIGRLHRFYRHPELLVHNGRLQTFVGLLCDLRIRKGTEASLNSHLAATGKFTPKSVEKYLSEFRRGQSSGKLDKFVQLDGKGSSTPSTYLNLMGTLHRMGLLI